MIKVNLKGSNVSLTDEDFKFWEDEFNNGEEMTSDEREAVEFNIKAILNQDFVYKINKTYKNKSQYVSGHSVGDWIHPEQVDATIYNLSNKSNSSFEQFKHNFKALKKEKWFKDASKISGVNDNYMELFEKHNEFKFIMERLPESVVELATCFQVMSTNFGRRDSRTGRNGKKNNQYHGKLAENVAAHLVEKELGEGQLVLDELYQRVKNYGHDGGVDLTIGGVGVDVKTTKRNKFGNKTYEATVFNVQLKNEELEKGEVYLFAEYIEDDNSVNFIGMESKKNVKQHWNVYDKMHKSYYNGGIPMPNKSDSLTSPYVFLSKQIESMSDFNVDLNEFTDKDARFVKYHDSLWNQGDKDIVNSFYAEMGKRHIHVNEVDLKDVLTGNENGVRRGNEDLERTYNVIHAICHENLDYGNSIKTENKNNAPSRLLIRAGTQQENLGWNYTGDVEKPLSVHLNDDFGAFYKDTKLAIPGHDIIIGKLRNGEEINQIVQMVTYQEWTDLIDIANEYIPFVTEEQYVEDTIDKVIRAQEKSNDLIDRMSKEEWWDVEFVEVYEVKKMMNSVEKLFELHNIGDEHFEVVNDIYQENLTQAKFEILLKGIFNERTKEHDFERLDYNTDGSGVITGINRGSEEESRVNNSLDIYTKRDMSGEHTPLLLKTVAKAERKQKMKEEER